MRTMSPKPVRPVRDQIVDVALQRIGDASLDDLFKALTPESLAADAPWAASTVRYQFGRHGGRSEDRGRLSFRRRDLALAMLESAVDDAIESSEAVATSYAAAVHQPTVDGPFDSIASAIADNLAAFTPGATDDDIAPRERMYHLALAVCDVDSETARMLRRSRAAQLAGYAPVYEAFMVSTGRRIRPGRSMDDLCAAVSALLDGHLMRLRFDPQASADWIGEAFLAVFLSFTEPADQAPHER